MASLFQPLFYCGARDALGAAIATGKAYFYVVGSTSTFVDIYADAAETTPITHDATHPVVLDAGGKATVYLKDPAKVVITDSSDVVKLTIAEGTATYAELVTGTWGGSSSGLQTILTDIESKFGTGGQYAEGTATGTVSRDYHDVVRQFISPYDFGAVGDGSADDAVPLQRAINRAIATGLPLYIETGTFKTSVGLTVTSPLDIRGNGPDVSKITATSEAIDGLTCTLTGTDQYTTFAWRDFAVLLPYTNSTGNIAVKMVDCDKATLRNIHATATVGFHIDGGANTSLHDCVAWVDGVFGTSSYGFYVDGIASLHGCTAYGNAGAHGIALSECFRLEADGAGAYSCRGYGANYGFRPSGSSTHIQTVVGCYSESCTYGFKSVSGSAIIGCSALSSVTSSAEGSSAVELGNSWNLSAPVPKTYAIQTLTGTSPTFTLDTTKEVNVLRCTGSGSGGKLTINWPAVDPALPACTPFTIIVQLRSTISIATIVIDTDIVALSTPASLSASDCIFANFLTTVSGSAAKLAAITPWAEISGSVTWGADT